MTTDQPSPALFKEEQASHDPARKWVMRAWLVFWLLIGVIDLLGRNPLDAREEGALFIFSQWVCAFIVAVIGRWFIATQWGPRRLHITVLPSDVFISIGSHAGKARNIGFRASLVQSAEPIDAAAWTQCLAQPGEGQVFNLVATKGVAIRLEGGELLFVGTEKVTALCEALRLASGGESMFVHVRSEDFESVATWNTVIERLNEKIENLKEDGLTLCLRTGMIPTSMLISRHAGGALNVVANDSPNESMRCKSDDSALTHAVQFAESGFFVAREWLKAENACPEEMRDHLKALKSDPRTRRLIPSIDGMAIRLTTPLWRVPEDPPIILTVDADSDLIVKHLEVDPKTLTILTRHSVEADLNHLPSQIADLMATIPEGAQHFRPFDAIGLRLPV